MVSSSNLTNLTPTKVSAEGLRDVSYYEMVYVGHHKHVGVIVRINYENRVTIRLYQDHSMFVPKIGLR